MKIDVKILDSRLNEQMPAYATPGSAGLDLRACLSEPLTLAPNAWQLVPTGMAVGSSRVDLQACKLEYSIVSPK